MAQWAARQELKQKKAGKNKVVKAAIANPMSDETMDMVMRETAFQVAKLRYESEAAELEGQLDLGVIGKLLKSLELMGSTWIRRRSELAGKMIDVNSREFQMLMELLIDKFRAAMTKSGASTSLMDSVLSNFATSLDGFEEEAAVKLRKGV